MKYWPVGQKRAGTLLIFELCLLTGLHLLSLFFAPGSNFLKQLTFSPFHLFSYFEEEGGREGKRGASWIVLGR